MGSVYVFPGTVGCSRAPPGSSVSSNPLQMPSILTEFSGHAISAISQLSPVNRVAEQSQLKLRSYGIASVFLPSPQPLPRGP